MKVSVEGLEADFDEWFRNYPRPTSRTDALKAYRKAREQGASRETLLQGAMRYAAERVRVADPGERERFTMYPAKWLNGQRWTDQPQLDANGEGKPSKSAGSKGSWTERMARMGGAA